MLDITRDKPIKIAVRVQVPVRDHPKFNFVGKLLGPKGNSLKRLQEETMCKMAVLGKGSMRDRKKEEELRLSGDPRYAHLSEDLHVEISTYTAPAEAHARIAYALAEVRRFLVPDYHDDIRQEQMWEMQALNSAQNASSGTNGNCNGTTTTLNGHGTNLGNGTTHGNVTLNGNGLNGGNPEMMHHQSCGVDSIGSNGTSSGGGSSSNGNSGNNGCGGVLSGSDGNSNHPSSQQQQHQHSTSHHHHPHHHHHQHQQQQFLSSSASVAAAAAAADAAVAAAATVTDMSNLMPVDVNMTSANHFVNSLPTTDIEAQTLAFVESANAFLHPALRGVKTVSLAARKRPLLGGPRSSMNPTKRTVMTLIARARTAQAMHGSRTTAPMGE
nr:KH domain-containing, RNA-binding, signal transduction-associated protein 2-like [Aedes albopictus]